MTRTRVLVGGAVALFAGMCFLTAASPTVADDTGDVRQAIQKVADAIDKGDMAEAAKLAAEIAKSTELEEVMNLMSKRDAKNPRKKAFGVGAKPGAITPDGIEAILPSLLKRVDAKRVEKDSEALVEMAHRVAAISEVAKAKAPEKDEGAKKKKDWLEWAANMREAADELAKAAKSKKAADVKKAAAKLNSACNSCHGVFRD